MSGKKWKKIEKNRKKCLTYQENRNINGISIPPMPLQKCMHTLGGFSLYILKNISNHITDISKMVCINKPEGK